MHQLNLVFGTSQFAICTVLAAFMGGLAMRSFLAGHWAGQVRRPLVAYALLDVLTGLYGVAFRAILSSASPLYVAFWRAFKPEPAVFGAFQFVLLGVLLLPRQSAWARPYRCCRDSPC